MFLLYTTAATDVCTYHEDGVAGGEGDDVGAGDGGAAGGVYLDADVLDELHRTRLQRLVRRQVPLAVGSRQKDGRVAALKCRHLG